MTDTHTRTVFVVLFNTRTRTHTHAQTRTHTQTIVNRVCFVGHLINTSDPQPTHRLRPIRYAHPAPIDSGTVSMQPSLHRYLLTCSCVAGLPRRGTMEVKACGTPGGSGGSAAAAAAAGAAAGAAGAATGAGVGAGASAAGAAGAGATPLAAGAEAAGLTVTWSVSVLACASRAAKAEVDGVKPGTWADSTERGAGVPKRTKKVARFQVSDQAPCRRCKCA